MKKRFRLYALIAAGAVLLALAYFLFFRSAPSKALYDNLLQNGNFSQLDAEGNPAHWYKDAYAGLSGAEFEVLTAEDGNIAHIVNHMPKDARYAQSVAVEPNSLYRLHGYIKASAQDGRGANLSIANGYYFSESVYDTAGEWQEITLYGRTGENQREVTVFVRLGGYSGEATGEAWFKDVSLCKVDGIPEGYTSSLWTNVFASSSDDTETESDGNDSMLLAGVSAAYFLFFAFMVHFLRRPKPLEKEKGFLSSPWLAVALFLGAFALRLGIAAWIPGYNVDIGCFRAWGNRMADGGPVDFYNPADPFSSCDYPPGYMLVLWVVGLFGKLLGTGTTEWMVKIPPIAADIALCAILYQYAKKYLSSPAALALSLLYAFNPLIIAVSAAWGQADALMTLLLFLAVIYAARGKWKAALPLYVASVLFKPQALMFGPLGLAAFVQDIFNARKGRNALNAKVRDILFGLLFMALTALAIALPFSIHLSWDWLFTLYSKTMGRYAYATVNSCNLYFLLGKNWVSVDSVLTGDLWPALLTALLVTLPLLCAWLPYHRKSRLSPATENEKETGARFALWAALPAALILALLVLSLASSLTYTSLGTVMVIYCVAVIALLYVQGNDLSNLPVFGAALLLMLFNVGTMMHERYLFPAVALLLLGYALKKDVRILWLAVAVAIAGFLNVGCCLDRNIRIGGAAGHLNAPAVSLKSDMFLLEYLSAGLNCAVCFASLWLCADLSLGNALELSPETPKAAPLPQTLPLRKMTVRDWIILAAITIVYSVLAFTNLGSMKAPQTAFVSYAPDEEILFDLGKTREFQLLYYPGIHRNSSSGDEEIPSTFTIETSEDRDRWSEAYTGSAYNGDCFKWKFLGSALKSTYPVTLTGRYVRMTVESYDLTLFEMLFKDAETGEIITPAIVSHMMMGNVSVVDPVTGEAWLDNEGYPLTHRGMVEIAPDGDSAPCLIDEPDSMEGDYPSWYNSTYFDEIYHARTAYEHLHKMQPYEYTHPPLGKVMMSWAIAIFGMTPFGWRFAGALAGVLMLPGMYLLGKLLIKRSWGGMACAMLMALDLMHFTQTRIATIDSFVVLWIIWMVYFMLRWFYLDFFHTPFWKTLVPLFLSGLCMGLGVASKWTGCYAGVALALIFFWGIFRRARLVRAAKKIPEKQRDADENKRAMGGKLLLATVASCLVFFVLIPAVVYYCSYIPYFAYDGVGVTVDKIVRQAVGSYFVDGNIPTWSMLGYHSQPGLGMNHSFYSPWYEWPVIAKPMWYSSNGFEPEGYQMSITAMGNPALWWTGLLCIVLLLGVWIVRHLRKDGSPSLYNRKNDPRPALVLLCYFIQLMPWILVPRGTYIYHYFPCVPFLAAAIVLCLDLLADVGWTIPLDVDDEDAMQKALTCRKRSEWTAMGLLALVLVAAAVLFVAFFPYASGTLTRQSWMDAMRWFDRWLWY